VIEAAGFPAEFPVEKDGAYRLRTRGSRRRVLRNCLENPKHEPIALS
jgi:hypothetical protein